LTDALNEEADLHDLGTQLPRRRRKFIEEIINTLSPETLGDMQELVDGDVSVTDILTILDADPAYVEAMAKLYANKTLE
jgi:flagellar biosynthesis component FlhA